MLLSMDEPTIDRCCCADKKRRVLGSRVGHFFDDRNAILPDSLPFQLRTVFVSI